MSTLSRYHLTFYRRGKWNPDEDELLRKGFETHGKAWVKIAEMIPGRSQRQCRQRHLILNVPIKKGNPLLDDASTPKSSPDLCQEMSGMEESDCENFSDGDTSQDGLVF